MTFELTGTQMNFINTTGTNDPIWNVGFYVSFDEILTDEKIQFCENEIFRLNDALRIVIKKENNIYVQKFEEYIEKEYEIFDFDNFTDFDNFASNFVNEPITVGGIMYRGVACRLDNKTIFMFCSHHISTDATSAFIIVKQLSDLIKDKTPLSGKFSKHLEKDSQFYGSKRYERSLNFWKNKLNNEAKHNVFPPLESNIDYSSLQKTQFFSTSLLNQIKQVCEKNDVSVATFMDAVTSICLGKLQDENHFFIGSPVINRSTFEEFNTYGIFMHILPLEIHLKDEKFIEFTKEIENEHFNLFRYQNFTVHDIQTQLSTEINKSEKFFDVSVEYSNNTDNDVPDITMLYPDCNSMTLEIHYHELHCGLKAIFRYRTSVLNTRTIETLFDAVENIIRQVVSNPEISLSEISLLSKEQQKHILCDFSQGEKAKRTTGDTIYSLFEKQIHGRENEICIETSNSNITFKKFEALVSALDGEIQKHTLGKKQTVAVLCERSIEMYLSIYAVIRGGNAYLPISPDFPKERIEYILKDSGSCLLLAQDGFVNLAKDSVPVFNVSEFLKDENSLTHEALPSRAEPEDTAYVIYTSGSTGNPKGAKISHRSAVNRILWMQKKYPLEQDSVILQKTPYTFDVSVWEHFWWGMCSGHLAVSNPNEHFLPAKILEDCFKFKVTHLHFVPSVFKLFLDYLESHRENISNFASVKYVFLSGEALEAELIKRFYALFEIQKVKLANLYGPTECAVDVTYYDCLGTETDPVPIGKPIDNTSIYILDKYKKIVPLGVKGEIYIGGENVGQGYLNNEKLTKEKFTENPFEGGKLYKTGDYGFIRDDGQIVFLGRIDNQVKLGGQRIELGEIENAIMSIDGISSAAVLLKKDSVHEYLVAFYFGQKQNDDFILQKLSASLPKYMIPKFILFKEEMPLNPSGKLDRKVLEKIEIEIQSSEEKKEEPINGLEKMICRAFSEILKTPNVGRNSDFTLLGGTSLDIIKLLSKDEFAFLKAHDIIAHPTPRALASFIEEKTESSFKFLHPLHFQNAKKSIVIFPFAGGNANSFLAFCEAIKHNCSEVNIYFCDYLHSFEDCKKLSEEIFELSKTSEIYFYSHCVGSSIALETIKILEKENKSIVKHFISAASIPQKTPFGRNIWNFVSDKMLKSILASAGSKLGGLEKETQNEILKAFRNDTDFSTEILFRFKEKINCPVTVIISPDDIFTKNYKGAKKKWEKFSVNTPDVLLIDSKSHYFQTENAAELSKMIAKIIK